MARKQLAGLIVIVLVASTLSAVIAYRIGLRRSGASRAQMSAPAVGEVECIDFREAGSLTGQAGCVKGPVLRVYTSKAGNTFLDFCPDYRKCPFACVVFSEDRKKFGDLDSLWGRQVEIRGVVTSYEGRAEIILRDPGQIRVVP